MAEFVILIVVIWIVGWTYYGLLCLGYKASQKAAYQAREWWSRRPLPTPPTAAEARESRQQVLTLLDQEFVEYCRQLDRTKGIEDDEREALKNQAKQRLLLKLHEIGTV